MNGWQDVDAMWEADTAALWEKLNEPNPHEKEYLDSATSLTLAVGFLEKALDQIADAYGCIEDLPGYDKLVSIYESLDDLKYSVEKERDQFRKGWHK